LDNPGWRLEIDLLGTELEGVTFEEQKLERTEHDWVFLRVKGSKFVGHGGPANLPELLRAFRTWAETSKGNDAKRQ
jgi:hypothetical protein